MIGYVPVKEAVNGLQVDTVLERLCVENIQTSPAQLILDLLRVAQIFADIGEPTHQIILLVLKALDVARDISHVLLELCPGVALQVHRDPSRPCRIPDVKSAGIYCQINMEVEVEKANFILVRKSAPFKGTALPTLLPHQQALKKRFDARRRDEPFTVILFWRLGTGKTLGALSCFTERIDKPLVIIASNTLIHSNWLAYIKRLPLEGGPRAKITLVGYTEFSRLYCTVEGGQSLRGCTVIVDEIQRFRNAAGNDKMQAELSSLCEADELFLLSGSPMMGGVDDLCSLMCLVERDRRHCETLPSMDRVRAVLGPHLLFDCLTTEKAAQEGVLSVPESHRYAKCRDQAIRLLPWIPRVRLTQVPVEISWLDTYEYMNNISQAVNKKLNVYTPTTNRYHSAEKQRINGPKTEHAVRLLEDLVARKNGPVLLASQYIKNGIGPLIQRAHPAWTHAVLDGATEAAGSGRKADPKTWTRPDIVNRITKGKMDVLYMTSACGSEGLDLRNVRYLICLDIQGTEEAFRQLQGRIARFRGHKEPDSEVEVYQFIATFPKRDPTPAEMKQILALHIERTRNPDWTAAGLLAVLRDIIKRDLKGMTVDELLQKQNTERQRPIDEMKAHMLAWPETHYYVDIGAKACPSLKKKQTRALMLPEA